MSWVGSQRLNVNSESQYQLSGNIRIKQRTAEWRNKSWVCWCLQRYGKVHTLQVDSDTPRMGKLVETDYCCSRDGWIYTIQRTSSSYRKELA